MTDQHRIVGICGSGLIEAIDEMRLSGVINKQGKIVDHVEARTLAFELRKRNLCHIPQGA